MSVNGHRIKDIDRGFRSRKTRKPFFIIGNTVKGKGVSYMENKPIWHYRSPNKEEYVLGLQEINRGFNEG